MNAPTPFRRLKLRPSQAFAGFRRGPKSLLRKPLSVGSSRRCSPAMPFGVVLIGLAWTGLSALGDDWPGLLGPHRNGHIQLEQPLPMDRQASLHVRWKLPAGQGYAGGAIRGGKAVLYDRNGSSERVRHVDMVDGRSLWQQDLPADYAGGIDADKGPRCVPSITENRIVLYSASGIVTVLDRETGTVIWRRPIRSEKKADDGYFGAGSTPLVFQDLVIINVGGAQGGIVALSIDDGQERWSATDYDASYASPIAWPTRDGKTDIVVPTRLKTVGLEPTTGTVRWEVNFGQRGPTVNAATPIAVGSELLFLTASYGIGHLTLKNANASTGIEVQHQGEAMNSQYATPVAVGSLIYGSDGREDMGGSIYKCVDPTNGEVRWEESSLPISHSIAINQSQLLLVGIDGQISLLRPSPEGFAPYWTTRLDANLYRALPAVVDRSMLLRTNGSPQEWMAVEW